MRKPSEIPGNPDLARRTEPRQDFLRDIIDVEAPMPGPTLRRFNATRTLWRRRQHRRPLRHAVVLPPVLNFRTAIRYQVKFQRQRAGQDASGDDNTDDDLENAMSLATRAELKPSGAGDIR